MQPYQERVMQEEQELTERISKLRTALQEGKILGDWELMQQQLHAMNLYAFILRERIAKF